MLLKTKQNKTKPEIHLSYHQSVNNNVGSIKKNGKNFYCRMKCALLSLQWIIIEDLLYIKHWDRHCGIKHD